MFSSALLCLTLIGSPFLAQDVPNPADQQAAATAQPKDWIAMTESGLQIEAAAQVASGALEVDTPFGLYRTATDPVKLSFERRRDQTWKASLRIRDTATLLEAIETMRDNGQISALIEIADAAMRRNQPQEIRAALRGLESWGAKLDPVPKGMTQDERVQWLWERTREVSGPAKLLLAGRLAAEVMPAGNGVGERQLRQVELQKVLRDGDVLMQRVAILVIEAQRMSDPYLGAQVLMWSVYGHPITRDIAARTAPLIRPLSTREYWVRALLRASDSLREVAAQNLAWEMPDYAPKAFAILLAASGKRAPSRFKFADHSIQVVVDRREPRNLLQLEVAMETSGGELQGEYLENASVIKVCKLPEALRDQMLRYLVGIANDEQERTLEQWLEWYTKRVKKP